MKIIAEALGSTMATQVESFDDSASTESETSSDTVDDANMTPINFSIGSISLLIQTIPGGASTMVIVSHILLLNDIILEDNGVLWN